MQLSGLFHVEYSRFLFGVNNSFLSGYGHTRCKSKLLYTKSWNPIPGYLKENYSFKTLYHFKRLYAQKQISNPTMI